jgi:hypothetical protein
VAALLLCHGCTSTTALLDESQSALEYHRARYERLCAGGDSTSDQCVTYGTAINTLTDVLANTDAVEGELPKTLRGDVTRARKAVEAKALEMK